MEKIQDKPQLLEVSNIRPGGEDDEQNGPGTKTRSASHNKSVMKKVKDKAKKLKASITNPNKHDHDYQTETEETQYDQYSKAEDNCSEEKKAESTHNLPSKDLPEQGLDQLLQQEIDWSSPGAFTRVKGFGPRSALWLEVHRVRSETATLAAGEEPAAIAPLPASVQNINTDDDFRKAKADQLLGEKPYKQKNVHFLDADAK